MASTAHIALNAHLLAGEASYRSAGIHGYLYNMLAHLPAADSDLRYSVFLGQGALPENSQWRVYRTMLPTARPQVRIFWEQAVAPLAFARVRPDLVHGMGFVNPLLWPGPAVVTIFDLSFIRYPERLSLSRRAYLQTLTRFSARRARRVIAISESGKREIVELLGIPPERIDVALPGVNPDFRPLPREAVEAFRQEAGLPGRFILHVGTLEPRKNLEMLLEAYARLPQRGDVKLILAGGKGWQTAGFFRTLERLGLGRDVILPGYVPSERLPYWYNAAEVFVYPSVYEGFGMPLAEALACGVVAIGSDTSSLPEAVGPGGLLLPADDPQAWAETLTRLLDSAALRDEIAHRGYDYVQRLSWETTARQTVRAYRRALE